jgi:hypothetical protein
MFVCARHEGSLPHTKYQFGHALGHVWTTDLSLTIGIVVFLGCAERHVQTIITTISGFECVVVKTAADPDLHEEDHRRKTPVAVATTVPSP